MPYTQEQYDRAKKSLTNPELPPESRAIRTQRIKEFEGATPDAKGYVQGSFNEDEARGYFRQTEPETPPVSDAAKTQGFSIDLSRPNVIQSLGMDPRQAEASAKIRAATEDTKLPNASKLKVMAAPTDWRPEPERNPFSTLPAPPKDTQYFYEPSVEEFKEAVKTGALATQLQKEFPGIPDPLKLIDKDLQGSKVFRAYQDAAWKHALAEAMRSKTPISRIEFSQDVGTLEKLQAKALDPAVAFSTGALSGFTVGAADPAIRALAPETAEAERRSRMRNPTTALVGEIGGALSPRGLPARIAGTAVKGLGKLGLGSRGVQGVTKGLAAAGASGAVEANVRAIAQAAADALDAGDSAVEALHRMTGILSPEQVADRSIEGGGLALLGQGAGEAIGTTLGAANRGIVGGAPKDILLHGQASGIKMSPVGEPVLPKDLTDMAGEAAAKGRLADQQIAEELADPLARQRLLEQETQHRTALEDTAKAREAIESQRQPVVEDGSMTSSGATVPTADAATRFEELAAGLSDLTGGANANEIRAMARKLRARGKVTPAQIDADIDALERAASSKSKDPDPDFLAAKKILLDLRDDFQLPEDNTIVENFAIRDKEGNVKPVEGYSALKARQARDKSQYEVTNAAMGLPLSLKPDALPLPKAPDKTASAALAESLPPRVKFGPNQREGFVERIATSGNPAHGVRMEHYRDLAARSGIAEDSAKLTNLSRLRAAQNWKQYLGRAISGIGTEGGTYVKANNLLRAVPAFKSLSGGLPAMEASPQAVDVVDRFLANAVPSWKWANLRGGQAARPTGAIDSQDKPKGTRDTMTDEEAQFALTVIRNLIDMEGK